MSSAVKRTANKRATSAFIFSDKEWFLHTPTSHEKRHASTFLQERVRAREEEGSSLGWLTLGVGALGVLGALAYGATRDQS